MKRDNLQLMANHLKNNVIPENFEMDQYRANGDYINPVCGSVGCTVGNCTVLDTENVMNNFINSDGRIDFTAWSIDFTGIYGGDHEYDWCFHDQWTFIDNTPTGAALRIEWLLNNGLPENWHCQMYGKEKLCYM